MPTSPELSPTDAAAPGTSGCGGNVAARGDALDVTSGQLALRAALANIAASDGLRPESVSGPARLRLPMTAERPAERRAGEGGWTGSARICSIGVASPTVPPYWPMPAEMAPMLRATPSAPGQ